MTGRRNFILGSGALMLASCGPFQFGRSKAPHIPEYHGQKVTAIQVQKANRKLYLLHDNTVLRAYNIALGSNPVGPKQVEGDGKTPEGIYYISYKKLNSDYHLGLKVSYPNTADRARAQVLGKPTGGDIYIHGGPTRPTRRKDWTAGCISVTDAEIEEIFSMVGVGTMIQILP